MRLNWKFILSLSPFGIVMGILMVAGLGTPGIQILWLSASILAGYLIAKTSIRRWIVTALVTGIIWGSLHNLIQAAYYSTYLGNNPGYENIAKSTDNISARFYIALSGPLAGLAIGIVIVTAVWLVKKWIVR